MKKTDISDISECEYKREKKETCVNINLMIVHTYVPKIDYTIQTYQFHMVVNVKKDLLLIIERIIII